LVSLGIQDGVGDLSTRVFARSGDDVDSFQGQKRTVLDQQARRGRLAACRIGSQIFTYRRIEGQSEPSEVQPARSYFFPPGAALDVGMTSHWFQGAATPGVIGIFRGASVQLGVVDADACRALIE
ncbi:MAG: hypothetical protein AAGA56_31390, partial [Myxococcota bacterium]